MNRKKIIFLLLLMLVMAALIICIVQNTSQSQTALDTGSIGINDEKNDFNVITDDVKYDRITVTYRREFYEDIISKTPEGFFGIETERVEFLTNASEDELQKISLILKDQTKDGLLEAVEVLKRNEAVVHLEYGVENESISYENVLMANALFLISSNGKATINIAVNGNNDDISSLEIKTKLQKKFLIFWITVDNGQKRNVWTEKTQDGNFNASYELQLSNPGDYRTKSIIKAYSDDKKTEKIKIIATDVYIGV